MKNFKRVLFSLLAAVMVCIIPFGVACKGCKEEDKKPATNSVYLANLRIDSSAAKTLYDLGEEFTSEGLVVTAVMSDETEKDVTSSATIDSSAYNKDAVGEYQIGVTYEENSVIKNGTYTVTVEDKVLYDGLVISFADGYSDTVVLDGETTASVDLTKITVKEINEDGTEGGVVTPDSIKVYQGLTEKTATENVVSGLAEGIYQIVVEKPSDRNEGYLRKGMRNFYVVDNLDSLTLAAEAVKTQSAGANTMKATWIFTATFTSGKTQDVTENVTYDPDVDTKNVGTRTTVASYKFVNVKDETTTKTVSIEYTIEENAGATAISWLVSDTAQDPEPEISSGTAIEDNVLFKVTAETNVKYSIGKNATEGVGNTSKAVTVTLQDNSSHTFKRGIQTASDTAGSSDGGVTGVNSDAYIFTAKQDITLRLYMVFSNSSFNSDRQHTFTYQINSNAATTTTKYTKRQEANNLPEISLKANDVLKIYATNYAFKHNDETSSDDPQAGRLWLFGAEATGVGGTAQAASNTFDLAELEANILERVKKLSTNENPNNNNAPYYTGDTLGDKIQLEASDFEGDKNGFITFLTAGTSKSSQYRHDAQCIEIKGDRLQFTLSKPGTITIVCSSTGTKAGSNESDIALKDASGSYMTATGGTDATTTGYYTVTNTTKVTITFENLPAGTYTLTAGTTTHDRGARIHGITVEETATAAASVSVLYPVIIKKY